MASTRDSIELALETRLLGSGEFYSHDKNLNQLLSLQYRVHYHIIEQKNVNVGTCKVLLSECLKVKQDKAENLHRKILSNLVGILEYYTSESERSSSNFKDAREINSESGAFETFLNLENLFYRGRLQKDPGTLYKKELMAIVNKIPNETHALIFHYLDLIIDSLSMNWKDVLAGFPKNPLTYYIAVRLDHESHDEDLLKIGTEYLDTAKFPKADESNSSDLEQFHIVLQYYFKKQKSSISSKWGHIIVGSMSKTFQSMTVSKSAMCYFAHEKNTREAVLNFVNFLNYNKNYQELNNGIISDFVSLIHSYQFILTNSTGHDIQKVFFLQKTIQRFEELLETFYKYYSIPVIRREDSLDWISNCTRLVLPRTLTKLLAKSWRICYTYNREDISKLLNNDNCYYLANSLAANPDSSKVKFQYALTLATRREIELSIKFVKSAILDSDPNNYQAWHLLALCESVNENKDVSFKIVCSVLEAMKEAHDEGSLTSAEDKWQLVHIKLTQLSIIEDTFGVNDALELLPDLFELFNSLFDKGKCNLGSAFNQCKEYLLQFIWLFALKLYANAKNQSEAQNALAESLNVKTEFKNLNNNLARGYLSLGKDGTQALKEFESVLFYDPLNVDAIVGIAKSLIPDLPQEPSYRLSNEEKNLKNTVDAFAGDRDRSAAFARLKLLMEQVIEKSIDAYHTPEIWWYLSQIYEIYGDSDRQEMSLWNCVKFQELQPIRDFKNCNF